MRRLYIHCGLAKTGTTSIQRYLSSGRESLRARGVEYPEIGLNLSGIAHHGIADQLNAKTEFDATSGPVGDVLSYLAAPSRQPTVILSSEGFVNCLNNRRTRSRFLGFLQSALKLNDAVFVVFRVRPFGQYFDSWYLQRLKSGGAPVDIDAYVKESLRWIRNYFRSLTELNGTIGLERIVVIDANEGNGDAVSALLTRIGIADQIPNLPVERYNERVGLKKAALLYQLQQLANAEGAASAPEVATLRNAIVRMEEFPDDIFRYRVIPFKDANKIQLTAHTCAAPFLRPLIAQAIKPEPEFYDAVSLPANRLSAEDQVFLGQSLPPELQSGHLMDLWRKSSAPGRGLRNRRNAREMNGPARRLVAPSAKQ
jgi:hypothetical protein